MRRSDSHRRESSARYYPELFPATFEVGYGSHVRSTDGRTFLDFFGGAGALGLGHNHPAVIDALRDFLGSGSVLHALDLDTSTRSAFLDVLEDRVLQSMGLDYRVQITAPSGADAVEAALKLARIATGRRHAGHFAGSYHGMTLGALSVTSDDHARVGAGVELRDCIQYEFPREREWKHVLHGMAEAWRSQREPVPACVIIESIQGEGGVHPVPVDFLRALRRLCTHFKVMLVVDEIQTGCMRTGTFFGFSAADILPDVVILSKGLTGIGVPFAMLLIAPDWDVWSPGQHAGTFRGNQMGMVAAGAALHIYSDPKFMGECRERSSQLESLLRSALSGVLGDDKIRGRGFMWGVDVSECEASALSDVGVRVSRFCFDNGLLVEPVGDRRSVLKLMPPLITEPADIRHGVETLAAAVEEVCSR